MRHTSFILFFLFFLCSISFAKNAAQQQEEKIYLPRYSLEDLEILEDQKNYNEFFKHALDILPSERTSLWKEMVINMALGWTTQLLKQKIISKEDWKQLKELHKWPTLQVNEFFLDNRGKLSVRFFSQCYQNSKSPALKNRCTTQLVNYWSQDPRDLETGLALGKMIQKNDAVELNELWSFYKFPVLHELSVFFCKKEHVKNAVWLKLQSLATKSKSLDDLSENIDKLLHTDCWKNMVPKLHHKLSSNIFTVKEQSYQLLKAKQSINSIQKEIYQLQYLLNNPQEGDQFNLAWNGIKKLSYNHAKREKLLSEMKNLNVLPDTLLKEHPSKAEIILKHIHKSFPEYLDFYARTCIKYLKGEEEFPSGNPTMNCPYLFKLGKDSTLVDPALHKNYQKIKIRPTI